MGDELKAIILAGGMGTRLREETEYRPKPMVEIGGRPIIWHIMKNLSVQGINEFVICLGYKGDQIKDYFLNYDARSQDFEIDLGNRGSITKLRESDTESWKVTLADTGSLSLTAERIRRIEPYVNNEKFLCTYGDGLADINISELMNFHESHGRTATVTAVRPRDRFGAMQIDSAGNVLTFSEKPRSEKWVNGGFFIFEPQIFEYLDDGALESKPLETLASTNQLLAFKHDGFWQPMDTYRESQELNNLWDSKKAPWKNW
jgi:glucose-1-phosphate cytidylyltransferase